MAKASETDRISKAVHDALGRISSPPQVKGALIEFETDEAGDPAVVVTVVLADETGDSDWVSSKLDPIAEAVRAAVAAIGADRYPYVRFAKWSDVPKIGGFGPDERVWKRVG